MGGSLNKEGFAYRTAKDKAAGSALASRGVFASRRVANPRKGRLRTAEAATASPERSEPRSGRYEVCDGDLRPAIAAQQPFAATAPVSLLIAADLSDPIYTGARSSLSNYDAGIVSGNIYLYCAANGLATVCRASMDREKLKKSLKLDDKTAIHLNHPIGYPANGK